MLVDREIDAILGLGMPACLGADPNIRRLFSDYREMERSYYRKTRIFPINQIVVVRKRIVEKELWVAASLYKAFEGAKRHRFAEMQREGAQRFFSPKVESDIEELEEIFEGDPWPYGLQANRRTLEAYAQYQVDQGFLPALPMIDDLIVPV